MYLLLDSGVLGVLCHTSRQRYQALEARLWKFLRAAQAHQVGGTVVTTNRKHLSQFVPTIDWTEIPTTT
jgi:hypothetical protein